MKKLTIYQRKALDDYYIFMDNHPEYFKQRKLRKIICDRVILEEYVKENDISLGVLVKTPYMIFIVDLVQTKDAKNHMVKYPYQRLLNQKEIQRAVNVVILGSIANNSEESDNIVLIKQERHATGIFHLELPRGFGEFGLSGEENSLKELREETGYIGSKAYFIGSSFTDSGITNAKVFFYYIPIISRIDSNSEITESISNIQIISISQIWNKISSGEILDSFTIQALALFENFKRLNHM